MVNDYAIKLLICLKLKNKQTGAQRTLAILMQYVKWILEGLPVNIVFFASSNKLQQKSNWKSRTS